VPRYVEWTEQELSDLRAMAEKNASAVRIAARVKRTVNSVRRRAAEMGVKLRSTREYRVSLKRAQELASR
jgi:polysaccharide deacetylase 2 family uncharacterized protein YibQ